MTSVDKLEMRAIVKFCQQMGDTPSATYEKIKLTKGNKSASRSLVFSWHKRFKDGEEEITNMKGRGRKREINGTLVTPLAEVLQKEHRFTVRELSGMFDVIVESIYSILTKELKMRKVHARWLPRLLKDHEKKRRVAETRAFLRRVEREGDRFFSRIITTDETWLWLHDPETRSQSAVWKRSGSPPPKKARVSWSGGKYMFVMFADREGMILQHAVPKGQAINADYFCKVLRCDLLYAISKKRPGVPIVNFILHMDNASSHTADTTALEIAVLGFAKLSHPPYSPDLAPFDFAICPTIKSQLKGLRFSSLQELKAATMNITQQLSADWYKDVYRQWVHRHHRCIEHSGEYFEK